MQKEISQILVDLRNVEEVNKKLAEGYNILTTLNTTDTVLVLLGKGEKHEWIDF